MSKYKIDPNCTIKHENKMYTFKELVTHFLGSFEHVNHEIYRKIVKKVQRKYHRQTRADLRNKYSRVESRPVENKTDEELNISETNEKEHQLWIERERLAQIEFKAKQEKKQRELEKKHKKDALIEDTISKMQKSWHNPFVQMIEHEKKKCKYFIKTGVCKYGNMCTNLHTIYSSESLKTLIFPNMYNKMLLGYEILTMNQDTDEGLEYEEEDILEHFKSFYDDISNEFKKYGRLKQLVVCSNYEPHLRGNVYVQYEREKEAQKAYENLNGRFYGGKQIYCYFSHVKRWHEAICSLFLKKKCTKGSKCKYLHIFQNPYNEFKLNIHLNKSHLVNKNLKDWTEENLVKDVPSRRSWDDDGDLEFHFKNLENKKRPKIKEHRHHHHHHHHRKNHKEKQ